MRQGTHRLLLHDTALSAAVLKMYFTIFLY